MSMEPAREQSPARGPDEKRERILISALRVFGRQGFHQATIEEVAREAGIGKGTIYLYVPSKEALLQAAVEHVAGQHFRQAAAIAGGEGDPLEKIRRILELENRFFLSHRDVARAFLNDQAGIGYGVSMRESLTEMQRRRKAILAGLVARAQEAGMLDRSFPAEGLALALMGMTNALLIDILLEEKEADAAGLASFCVDLLLRGARP